MHLTLFVVASIVNQNTHYTYTNHSPFYCASLRVENWKMPIKLKYRHYGKTTVNDKNKSVEYLYIPTRSEFVLFSVQIYNKRVGMAGEVFHLPDVYVKRYMYACAGDGEFEMCAETAKSGT